MTRLPQRYTVSVPAAIQRRIVLTGSSQMRVCEPHWVPRRLVTMKSRMGAHAQEAGFRKAADAALLTGGEGSGGP